MNLLDLLLGIGLGWGLAVSSAVTLMAFAWLVGDARSVDDARSVGDAWLVGGARLVGDLSDSSALSLGLCWNAWLRLSEREQTNVVR